MSGGDTPSIPSPSEVREQILAEHSALRETLEELTQLIGRARSEEGQEVHEALREATQRLHDALVRHLDLEDRILVPAIRDADGFGPVRADQLAAEHLAQREEIELTLGRVAREFGGTSDLAERLERFVGRLRRDMEHEEEEFLDEELLRDDIIRVGFIG